MIEFKKISEYPKGTLYNQLVDAYSFNDECKKFWDKSWKEYDDYFYDNLDIVENYSFIKKKQLDSGTSVCCAQRPRTEPCICKLKGAQHLPPSAGPESGRSGDSTLALACSCQMDLACGLPSVSSAHAVAVIIRWLEIRISSGRNLLSSSLIAKGH